MLAVGVVLAVVGSGCASGLQTSTSYITSRGANLNGIIGSNRTEIAAYYFEYGTTTAYGTKTTIKLTGLTANVPKSVTARIAGLASATTYHFRVCAKDQDPSQSTFRCNGDRTFTTGAAALSRATADRTDDFTGPQVHLVYALPSDRADRALDTNGAIGGSTHLYQNWLAGQADGRALRIDTSNGAFDITFFRLNKTDAQVRARNQFVRDEIEAQMIAAGITRPGKIYAVYYDGSSNFSCGGAAWPPDLVGIVGALYMFGDGCPTTLGTTVAGYREYSMIHELFHTLGFVPECSPNHTLRGHVDDPTTDLMWAGRVRGIPQFLDVGHDDYYKHNIPGLSRLRRQPHAHQLNARGCRPDRSRPRSSTTRGPTTWPTPATRSSATRCGRSPASTTGADPGRALLKERYVQVHRCCCRSWCVVCGGCGVCGAGCDECEW